MNISNKSCIDFVSELASKQPVPGGGGAAALVGGIGVALSSMVSNLTVGKKKYAEHEESLLEILKKAEKLENELLRMIDEDAECFLPLSKAYGLPTETDEEKKIKQETMEKKLKMACEVPLNIVRACHNSIKLHEELVDKGSRLLISDVGDGVQCLRAAILSAKLCVFINTNSIKDSEYVDRVESEVNSLVKDGVRICDEVYIKVEAIIIK